MTATATAHGLTGKLVEPDWPPLALSEVRALLHQFPGRGEPIRILTISPRPFSAASVVDTSTGPVFIKRHHRQVRDREGLLEEHRFLAHLRAHGAQVPRVIASASGETAIETDGWTYEIHETPAGVDLYQDAISWTPLLTAAHAHAAGEALARLHLAAQGFAAPRRKTQPLVAGLTVFAVQDSRTRIAQYLRERPALEAHSRVEDCCDTALELLAPFHRELLPLLPDLEPLWTHNDLHGSNLMWSSAGAYAQATAIIDFGLADRTNAVHDIAHAIERNIVEWLSLVENSSTEVPIHLNHLRALLSGYDSVRPFSAAEAAALAPMTALCHAEFALTEADYFLSVLHSEEKARLAYDDYLVGHARWFRGPGARLLRAIRNWASNREDRATKAQRP